MWLARSGVGYRPQCTILSGCTEKQHSWIPKRQCIRGKLLCSPYWARRTLLNDRIYEARSAMERRQQAAFVRRLKLEH